MHTQSYTTCQHCAELERRVLALRWNDSLGMLNQAGLMDAIERLEDGFYTVIFAARLSATFAGRRQVRKQDITLAIEDCSIEVLAKKGARQC